MISKLSEKQFYFFLLVFIGFIEFVSSAISTVAFLWGAVFFRILIHFIFKMKNNTDIVHYVIIYMAAFLRYGLSNITIISTDVIAYTKVLEGGNVGSVVHKEDFNQLSATSLKLMEDRQSKSNQTEYFNQYILQNYSKRAALVDLLKVYQL